MQFQRGKSFTCCVTDIASLEINVWTSRTVLAYNHDAIYSWALESNIFELKANKLFCNHELYICFENVNDNWLVDYLKSEADARKPTFLIQKMLVTL